MAALAINALLGNQTLAGSLSNHNLAPAATKIGDSSTIIHRKHYNSDSSGGHHHHYGQEFSGHTYSGHHTEKKGRNIALTALTLLSFLFFLHILQQCLQDQMDDMNPQVIIMQARIKAARESEAKEKEAKENAAKEADKRVGESSDKHHKGSVHKIDKKEIVAPPFKKADNEYQFDKVQVPLKIRSAQGGRHR